MSDDDTGPSGSILPPPPPPGAHPGVGAPGGPLPPPTPQSAETPERPLAGSPTAASASARPGGGSRRGLVIGLVVAAVALVGVLVFFLTRDDDGDDAQVPAPTQEPTGLGDDAVLNAMAADCYDGDMAACDDLFQAAGADTAYEDYGDTCAGRQESGTGRFCTVAFPDG